MPLSKRIILRAEVVGFHCWPTPNPAVSYLGAPHRHRFGFRLEAAVSNNDRDVEFHMLKRALLVALNESFQTNVHDEYEFGGRSCEAIAEVVIARLKSDSWPILALEVWEDDECGARIEA